MTTFIVQTNSHCICMLLVRVIAVVMILIFDR